MTSPSSRGFVASSPVTASPALQVHDYRGPSPEQTAHDQPPELRCIPRHPSSGAQVRDGARRERAALAFRRSPNVPQGVALCLRESQCVE